MLPQSNVMTSNAMLTAPMVQENLTRQPEVETMADQVQLAQNRLYGDSGLKVSDMKLFPGSSRDVTKEDFAEQINKSLAEIESGDYDLVDKFED